MTTQPEALRLADELKERFGNTVPTSQAAAELHRLHAENKRLRQINQSHEMKLSVRGYEIQIADLEAQRDALKAERDALKAAAEKGTEYVLAHINQDLRAEIEKANACIRKMEVKREKVAQWMIRNSYATGHGDTIEDLLEEMEWQVRESERKAILKQADSLGWVSVDHIRARGET